MRKIVWLAFILTSIGYSATAQDDSTMSAKVPKTKKDWSKVNLGNRANDHFMIQFGYDGWAGAPDSVNISGFSRFFNAYLMYDIPFKTAPRLSFAGGLGIGSSSIFFKDTYVDIAGKNGSSRLAFRDVADENHFKKYKVTNVWAEVPLELRFVSDPIHTGKAFKFSIGAKVGTMIDAHTKGKNLQNGDGNSLYGTKYIAKEKSKKYFNNTRLAGTARIGYGPFTLYGAYQITNILKDGAGAAMHPYSIGLCLSGL